LAVNTSTGRKLLTAGHCAQNGELAITGDPTHTNDKWVGTVTGRTVGGTAVARRDLELIDPATVGSTAGGYIYNGVFLSASDPYTSNRIMPIGGTAPTFLHNLIYASGALSGWRPTVTVMAVDSTFQLNMNGTAVWVSPLIRADKEDGQNVAGNGDSGGPVGWFTDDFSHFLAMGTMVAGDSPNAPATCTGVPASPAPNGRKCSYRVFYAPILDSLQYYGASIITG
jgi:hypothetical protein